MLFIKGGCEDKSVKENDAMTVSFIKIVLKIKRRERYEFYAK